MNPILLIAANFLRQMRWLVLVYPLIAIALGVGFSLFMHPGDQEAISGYLFQLITYALAIAVFLGSQANFNERKSRRILGVLSKGIERRDYLAGLMVGVFATSGVFVTGMLIGALCIAIKVELGISVIVLAMSLIWLSCCLSTAIAVFLSTFLHPLFAAAMTFVLVGGGAVPEIVNIPGGSVLPVYQLNADARSLLLGGNAHLVAIPMAVVEIVVFWLLAGWIFERRDIAVAIE
jgi:ABC-type transport system involved in multi-copper enzyme maturation permease subunit